MKRIILAMIVLCSFAAAPASAQQTTGNINGRIVDAQNAAIPGVTVTARSAHTGFVRTDVTDGEGCTASRRCRSATTTSLRSSRASRLGLRRR